jgi:hypothetical protein
VACSVVQLESARKWKKRNRAHINRTRREKRAKNPEAARKKDAAYRAKHRPRIIETKRARGGNKKSNLRRNGWTVGEYEEALRLQNNRCWLCGAELTQGKNGNAHADHNHKTGYRRAILCLRCNITEGHVAALPMSLEEWALKLRLYWATFDVEAPA